MQVLLHTLELGLNLGPSFFLSANTGPVSPSIIKRQHLLSGIIVEVPNNASNVVISSIGQCSNSSLMPIVNGNCTNNPTATPTATPTES